MSSEALLGPWLALLSCIPALLLLLQVLLVWDAFQAQAGYDRRAQAYCSFQGPSHCFWNRKCSATWLSNHTHTLTAIQAVRSCHCSHERIICNYLFTAVYMWKMPQISTLSPLALNHLPSTCLSSRNKPHLGRSLHKRQTKSQPTAQCIPISTDRLCVLAL